MASDTDAASPGAAVAEGSEAAAGESAAAASGGQPSAALLSALTALTPSLDTKITAMRQKSRDMKNEKKRLAKELRNAEKRRKRLRARCKELPAEDLLEVLAMRRVRDAEVVAGSDAGEPGK